MIRVLIPDDIDFSKYEEKVKQMYYHYKSKICDDSSFEDVKKNTFFYLFLLNNDILGVIYYFIKNNKLFLNAFAKRKFLKEKLYCLKLTTTWFEDDIYAEAQNRPSVFCLYRLGFQKAGDKLFVLKKSKNSERETYVV